MEPTLHAGDLVLVDPRAYRKAAPAPGHVVVATHPGRPTLQIIKRVRQVDLSTHACYLESDNQSEPSTQDSSTFGLVALDGILGRVVARV